MIYQDIREGPQAGACWPPERGVARSIESLFAVCG
jgi:hypothetical protein